MTEQDLPELQEALAALKEETSKALNTLSRLAAISAEGDSAILPTAAKARWLQKVAQHATILQQVYSTAKGIYQR